MNKVYGFTNEFVGAYDSIYNFDNKSVLSVLGSGDQYFTAILNGAKDVTVYDINIIAWYHFVLKFMAIRYLSYEDFCKFFFTNNLHDVDVYLELRKYLPKEVKDFFDDLVRRRIKFSTIKFDSSVFSLFTVHDYENFIPFLKKTNYYKLQSLLNNRRLPKCYISDVLKIMSSLDTKYDLMLLSNIYAWIDISVKDYKDILDKCDISLYQAHYFWHKEEEMSEFLDEGFSLFSFNATFKTDDNPYNYVLTYTK